MGHFLTDFIYMIDQDVIQRFEAPVESVSGNIGIFTQVRYFYRGKGFKPVCDGDRYCAIHSCADTVSGKIYPDNCVYWKAILISTLGVAVLYVILGYAAVCLMPYEKIANQSLGVVAKKIMPTGLFLLFAIGGAIGALLTILLGCIAAMPWPILSSAKDGWLPAVFKKVTKKDIPGWLC